MVLNLSIIKGKHMVYDSLDFSMDSARFCNVTVSTCFVLHYSFIRLNVITLFSLYMKHIMG